MLDLAVKTALLIAGLMFPTVILSGKTGSVPALQEVADTAISKPGKLTIYLDLAEKYKTLDGDSSLYFLEQAEKLCGNAEMKVGPAIFYRIAALYTNTGYFDKALDYFRMAAAGYEAENDFEWVVKVTNWIGYTYSQLGDSEKAIEILLNNLSVAEKKQFSEKLPSVHMMLGFAYRDYGDNRKAMDHFMTSKLLAEKHNITDDLPNVLNEIGNLYSLSGNLAEGLKYQLKSLEMRQKENDLVMIGYSYNDIANSYFMSKKYYEALDYFRRSLDIQKRENNLWAAFYCYINIASVYDFLNLTTEQRDALDSAKDIADLLRLKPLYEKYYEGNYLFYERIKDYRNVLENFKLFITYRDSVKSEANARQVALITGKYNTEKKDREITAKQSENQKLKLVIGLFVLGFVSLVITTVLLTRFSVMKRRANKLLEEKNLEMTRMNEQLLRRSQEITSKRDEYQKLNATKDKFFSIIAHDLKNPFNGLIGITDLLLKNQDTFSEEELNQVYFKLNEMARVSYSLLENLLLWSRSQTKSLQINPVNIDLNYFVPELIQLYSEPAKAKKIQLFCEVEPEAMVFADENMLHTVLRNLVSNAIKFTGEGGKISVVAARSGELCEITVTDNGSGITSEDIDKLFRIDVNTATIGSHTEKGSGLGLILCKEFTEMNHGNIKVDSSPGIGTTFTIILPVGKTDKNGRL